MAPKTRRAYRQHEVEKMSSEKFHSAQMEEEIFHDADENEAMNEEVNEVTQQNDGNGAANGINEVGVSGDPLPRKTIGPTFKVDLWGRPRCLPRIQLEFDEVGEPIGENAAKFSEFLGIVVRIGKDLPIDIADWCLVSKASKLELLNRVKNIFDVPLGTEHWVLQSMGTKWRNFKAYLKKKYYKPGQPALSQLAVMDERLVKEQWEKLVAYWDTEKAKITSERNKQARASNKMNHCNGNKSYSRMRKEMFTQLGRPPSRAELFMKCYTKKNGAPSASDIATTLGEMNERSSQLPPGSTDSVGPNDVFGQVMGNRRCNFLSNYYSSVEVTGAHDQLPSKNTSYRIIHEQHKEPQKMKDKFNEQEHRFEEQEHSLQDLTALVTQLTNATHVRDPSSASSIAPTNATNHIASTSIQPTTSIQPRSSLQLRSSKAVVHVSLMSLMILLKL